MPFNLPLFVCWTITIKFLEDNSTNSTNKQDKDKTLQGSVNSKSSGLYITFLDSNMKDKYKIDAPLALSIFYILFYLDLPISKHITLQMSFLRSSVFLPYFSFFIFLFLELHGKEEVLIIKSVPFRESTEWPNWLSSNWL